jgi:hypothetical protein
MFGTVLHTPATLAVMLAEHEVELVYDLAATGAHNALTANWRRGGGEWVTARGLRGWDDVDPPGDTWLAARRISPFANGPLPIPSRRSRWTRQTEVDYSWFTATREFRVWVDRLLESPKRVAVACREQYWTACRRGLIADYLEWAGAEVEHINTRVYRDGDEWVAQPQTSPHTAREANRRSRLACYPDEVLMAWVDPEWRV